MVRETRRLRDGADDPTRPLVRWKVLSPGEARGTELFYGGDPLGSEVDRQAMSAVLVVSAEDGRRPSGRDGGGSGDPPDPSSSQCWTGRMRSDQTAPIK